ncbi:MAG TPA: BtpA/SgcQ family protein [Vicinamibacteria bacterium]|nr:BtpA/SgcQ family protein [Vicinamibacteria bacterium]
MDRLAKTRALFGAPRALVGVIHLPALPGAPKSQLGVRAIAEAAAAEALLYRDAGFHAVMIENMHDRPYLPRAAGPEIVAAMAVTGREVRRAAGLPLGVQVLAGANRASLAVAHACGGAFVRVEGLVFAHVADEGLMTADAGELLRYRRAIGAEGVRILADVKKKHSAHAITADVDLVATAHAAEFFLADGVVVTGPATGRAAEPAEVRAVAAAASVPVVVGSGVTPQNLSDYVDADAFIVGSSLKFDGLWSNPIEPERLAALRRAFETLPPR